MRRALLILTEIALILVIIILLIAMWMPAYIGGNKPAADTPARSRR